MVPISRSHYVVSPLGLGYLATSLRKAGFDRIKILDSVKEVFVSDKFRYRDEIATAKSGRISIVFLGLRISEKKHPPGQKRYCPKQCALVGGPHVSATGTSILADMPEVDYAFLGEAEIGLALLVQRLLGGEKIDLEAIPGLVWRGDHGSIR